MTQESNTAKEVSEFILDRTTQALLRNDFDAFKSCFALPSEIETFERRRQLNTEKDLWTVFDALRLHHRTTGVTDIVQSVVEAMFKDETTVAATHETRLLNKSVLTQEPYAVFSILENNGTGWRTRSMTFAIEGDTSHNSALMSTGKGTNAPNTA